MQSPKRIILITVGVALAGLAASIVGWYKLYNTAWILFYGVTTAVPFTLFMAAYRRNVRSKGMVFAVVLLALLHLSLGVPILVLFSTVIGAILGLLFSSKRYALKFIFVVGILAVVTDVFWPSKFPIGSELTTNRPTLLRLVIGIAKGDVYNRGGTGYFQSDPIIEQEVTLFGKYPILVGYADRLPNQRFEVQLLITVIVFLVTLAILWRLFRASETVRETTVLGITMTIIGVTLLPIYSFVPLSAIIGLIIGRYVWKSNLIVFSFHVNLVKVLFISILFIVLYHASFTSTLIDGFGYSSTVWESFNSHVALLSMVYGFLLEDFTHHLKKSNTTHGHTAHREGDSGAIETAILKGDLRLVKEHLSSGLDVNAPLDSRESRPIHYAVNSTPEILLLLIKHGANVNVKNSKGLAPIHTAASTANFKSLSILVENGADVNLKDNDGLNALKHALRGLPTDRLYASWGFPMNPSEQQARQKIARFLLQNGAWDSENSPDADEVARVTGTSEAEVMRGFMLHLLNEGKNPFAPFSDEQCRDMAKQFPDVAERVRKKFGTKW